MAKRILIIGNGGRENALAWKIRQDGHTAEMRTGSIDELAKYAKDFYLTIVGPDQYLADGIVDEFQKKGLRVFGPTKIQAKIEWSKQFAKDLMQELQIPTARQLYKIGPGPVVIKKDGLALGKGVQIIDGPLVIEEFLEGMEVSTHAFCDGKTFKMFPTSQDHKQIFDGDKGPNTGGMGTIAPAVDVDASEIVGKIVKKLHYKGVLYPGLMLTGDGPKVLEFNARFGDPETQSYMRLLKTDLVEIADACIDGTLDQIDIEWHLGAAATVVLAASGYPGEVKKGDEITGIEEAQELPGVVVFPAGMTNDELRMTNGGRVLGVSAIGKDLKEALARAYEGVSKIHFKGMQYRKDIGRKVLNM
ncbi:MAG: phosphoribosylglycinamide synthetase C domain-containing protein [Patescibacteria group bacterium]